MDTNEKNIVAIDLGTSKIALTVAKVSGENIQIIYYKEVPSSGIRYSSIFNVMRAKGPLSDLISQAEAELNMQITQVIVGMPKYPVIQENSNAKMQDRGESTVITEEDIVNLKNFAQSLYPLEDNSKLAIYGSVAQSFSDGEMFQIIEDEIVGMTSDTLEGNFKIFVGKKGDLNKIDTLMNNVNLAAIRKCFTAESTAKAVLSESEMENGVALIDFGGGCTSVAIYHGNVMRHYASIPFGGCNITHDIKTECRISESLAENIKLAYGACMPEKLQNLSDKILHIKSSNAEPDKQLPVKYLSEIITARVEEIILAILYEIDASNLGDMLRSGIVVTGGSANLANLCPFINSLSGYKVRIGYPTNRFSYQGCDSVVETSAVTSIGLILSTIKDQAINCVVKGPAEVTIIDHGNGDGDGETVQVQGKIFPDSETIQVIKTDDKNEPMITTNSDDKPKSIRVTIERFSKFGEFGKKLITKIGNIYDSLNEDENEDEDEENNTTTDNE